ncbi:DNA-methyltransferase [Alteraurantiacibacter palmitatis]|uniref:Methyltransferase n=1 Tax=Alteraurantiacibacter palmitatis TaxID=2054628 RepID=A0ABV7E2E0_9SPHN
MFEIALQTHESCDDLLTEARPGLASNRIHQGDCRTFLKHIKDKAIDLVVTDPPYFLDGLDNGWRKGGKEAPRATGTVGGLPVGMKFDPAQGKALQQFMSGIAGELIRCMKPGAFALVFSQPRLSHRMAIALEDQGFEIRDLCVWHYTKRTQFKAFSQNHFIERMDLPDWKKRQIIAEMEGLKTPQLRGQHESIILAQKPRQGTFVENWQRWKTGLMNADASLDGSRPSNVMQVEKADLAERGVAAEHLTPKPLRLLSHLIELFSSEGQTVLDPFLGSGSTAVAAQSLKRDWIGIEINPTYVALAEKRLADAMI